MSISASDRGATGGDLAHRFTASGEVPASSPPSLLVIVQARSTTSSPFLTFPAPWRVGGKAGGVGEEDAAVLAAVNAVCERYHALDGAKGCVDDRVCGAVPPWVCCLPLVCCLGGACAVVLHTKRKVVRMTAEVNAVLSHHPGWVLCAASHKSRVHMSRVNATHGPRSGGAAPTVVQTLVWLEKRAVGNDD